MRAADLLEEDVKVPCVARDLRVGEKSVDQWRRAWASGGREALRSQGPAPPAASGVRPVSAARNRRRSSPARKAGRVQASGRAGCLLLSAAAALAVGHCASESIPITRRMR
ncbi:helix-turn-helix domain-containing protein [Streptomyces mirabilis]